MDGGWEPVHVSQKQIEFSTQEWLDKYAENFKAFSVGESFFIYPSWGSPSRAHPVNLLIDPSHGFGTGTHESTQLCLLALESTASEVRSLLDVGTGSGILAIAAQNLNPTLNVLAFDIDPLAVDAARENFLKNRIPAPKLWVGETRALSGQFELVVANLTAVIIRRLASEIGRLAREYLIVSGFTVDQGPLVLESLGKDFELLQVFSRNDWLCYKLRAWQEP
jgi:ribosomal protein L11 methyltransferase